MKLYYSPGACSQAPHIILLETGLPFEKTRVDLETKKLENGEDFLAIAPKGAVPMLELDDGELLAIEDKLRKDGVKDKGWTISRFKGLGEMNAEQLWETTMNPDTRRLLPVSLGDFDLLASEARFNMLMGKGEAAARRAWKTSGATWRS